MDTKKTLAEYERLNEQFLAAVNKLQLEIEELTQTIERAGREKQEAIAADQAEAFTAADRAIAAAQDSLKFKHARLDAVRAAGAISAAQCAAEQAKIREAAEDLFSASCGRIVELIDGILRESERLHAAEMQLADCSFTLRRLANGTTEQYPRELDFDRYELRQRVQVFRDEREDYTPHSKVGSTGGILRASMARKAEK